MVAGSVSSDGAVDGAVFDDPPPGTRLAPAFAPCVVKLVIASPSSAIVAASTRSPAPSVSTADRVELQFEMPLAEVVFDFFDKLKTISSGYA